MGSHLCMKCAKRCDIRDMWWTPSGELICQSCYEFEMNLKKFDKGFAIYKIINEMKFKSKKFDDEIYT